MTIGIHPARSLILLAWLLPTLTGLAAATVPGTWYVEAKGMTVFILDVTNPGWQDTGIDVAPGDRYLVNVRGVASTSTSTDAYAYWLGPAGRTEYYLPCTPCPYQNAPPLSVVGRLQRPTGNLPFYVGDGGVIYGNQIWNGRLALAFNDWIFEDNFGYFVVTITRFIAPPSAAEAKEPLPVPTLTNKPLVPVTSIHFDLPAKGPVRVEIFDSGGRMIRTLMSEVLPAGSYDANWDSKNEKGEPVPAGGYYCRVSLGWNSITEKLLMVK